MLIDSHIHIGQYYNMYINPLSISVLMNEVHADYFAVSSTTMCEENYEKVISEIKELTLYNKSQVLPVMWITPNGLLGNIAWFLESNVKWRCLKIHPFLHPNSWTTELLNEVVDIATELNLPVIIHTGVDECCRSNRFASLISKNPNMYFILAHGRPHVEATKLANRYSNAYIDSAFMSLEEMSDFVQNGLSHKLLWGTDMCIPKYYNPNIDLKVYYLNKLTAFRKICTQEQFEEVTSKNAMRIFNIS